MWRWIEIDPWGHAIHCAEAVWRQKVEGGAPGRTHCP